MPTFTPPTVKEYTDDRFFGRFGVSVGHSVVKVNGVFQQQPYPWLGDIADLAEGTDWFQGGRTYFVNDAIGYALEAAGFTVEWGEGYGLGPYGMTPYGE